VKTTLVAHREATVISIAAGGATASGNSHSQAGLSGMYLSMYLHKEAHRQTRIPMGMTCRISAGATNVFSIASDEGCVGECRGANYPNYAMNVVTRADTPQ